MKKRALAAVLAVTLMVGAAAFVRVERAAGELANRSEGPLVVAHRAGAALGFRGWGGGGGTATAAIC